MSSYTRRSFIRDAALAGGAVLLPVSAKPEDFNMNFNSLQTDNFWDDIRSKFPLTHERTYLNNGTIGPMPYPVIKAVTDELNELAGKGEYGGWEIARKAIAGLVNAKESEISLTHNTTEGINIVCWGLPLKKGDEVIITTHEHVGNAAPWINRSKLDGIVLKNFEPGKTAQETLDRIEPLISRKTRAIAVPHITCTTGTVLPIKEIAAIAKARGVMFMVDGAHGPGSTVLDMKDIDPDFYVSCTHKWLCGPAGTGFVYVREEMLDKLQAKWIGGYSISEFDVTKPVPTMSPFVPTAHRYDYGTQSAAQYIGVAAAVEFMTGIGIDKIQTRTREMAKYLQDKLLAIPDKVEMLSPVEDQSRSMMIGFRLKNMDYNKFGELATAEKFRIRLVPESHLNSIRISTHIYNNLEEIDRFVELVKNAG